MRHEHEDVLKVGDVVEFHRDGFPKPSRWAPQVVRQIRICEEYDDKEGVQVEQVSWRSIREYECLVLIVGTNHWGRNGDVRPVSQVFEIAQADSALDKH